MLATACAAWWQAVASTGSATACILSFISSLVIPSPPAGILTPPLCDTQDFGVFCGILPSLHREEPAAALWIDESAIIPAAMRVHATTLSAGISRTKEFEKKDLAQFAANVGTKCGHGCLYCSTGALLRMHRSFRAVGENPFESGYAILDPDTPQRVARDAAAMRSRDFVQLCTTVDAWSPEAQEHDLGRRCLEAVLSQSSWTMRILTKNVTVKRDLDIIERYSDRVLVGLSLPAAVDKSRIMSAVEPNASSNAERMLVLEEAHRRSLRRYDCRP